MRKVQEFEVEWPPGATVVLHSDGIASQWNLAKDANLAARRPAVVAGALYRDWRRERDDATVVVLRETGGPP